jgi:lipopolysaccharide/colanic/teichoic acid biosynthesis glycosyltransferase
MNYEQTILDQLEQQFTRPQHLEEPLLELLRDDTPFPPLLRNPRAARSLLEPRTTWGPLLGMTAGDLDRATASLAGRPQLALWQRFIKRTFDVVVAAVALIWVLLLTPFIAFAIKLESRGPVFFVQPRIGRDGVLFGMVKFRTMRLEAEMVVARGEGGRLFSSKTDPRVTRVGAFLRKYAIDELPIFVNVLIGHMSIVGPRPVMAREVIAAPQPRFPVRPGVTGLWQLSWPLRYADIEKLERRYIETWSLSGDVRIMWKTVLTVFEPPNYHY